MNAHLLFSHRSIRAGKTRLVCRRQQRICAVRPAQTVCPFETSQLLIETVADALQREVELLF